MIILTVIWIAIIAEGVPTLVDPFGIVMEDDRSRPGPLEGNNTQVNN